MPSKLWTAALVGALSAPGVAAIAQSDDKPPNYTPPLPNTRTDPQGQGNTGIDEERLARLVDAAVSRAMARQSAQAYGSGQNQQALASPQQQQALASPQQQYAVQPLPQTQYALQATTTQQAAVLVPAGRLKQHLASLGQHLVNCGQPKVKTMTLAPVTYTTTPTVAPVATTTQIVSVPAPTPTYTPQIPPAQSTAYPSPQQLQALSPPPKAPRK